MTLMRRHGSHPPSRLTHLERENAELRAAIVKLLDTSNAVDLWHQNWDLPFAGEGEWLGDRKLWSDARVSAAQRVQTAGQRGGEKS